MADEVAETGTPRPAPQVEADVLSERETPAAKPRPPAEVTAPAEPEPQEPLWNWVRNY
jgi:hypothetical protein